MERLGVLGGTFDPPHLAHLRLAEIAYQQLRLDLVLWAPTGQPPHKGPSTPAHHRTAMTQLAIADTPHFSLCRLDLDRPGPHYTADLLGLLREDTPSQTLLYFLLGEDSLGELTSWHTPQRILGSCRLAVYPRPGVMVNWDALDEIAPDIRARIDWLRGPPLEPASNLIRERVRQGQPILDLVPPAVHSYIEAHGLYRV